MKQYVIDELRPVDHSRLKDYFDKHLLTSGVGDIYWIEIDNNHLSDIQKEHASCMPFYFAIELEYNRLSCELLVRTKSRIKCSCIAYATKRQRDWVMDFVDAVFEKLEINI